MNVSVRRGSILTPSLNFESVNNVVIRNDANIPVAVAIAVDNGILIKTPADTDFNEVLADLGLAKPDIKIVTFNGKQVIP